MEKHERSHTLVQQLRIGKITKNIVDKMNVSIRCKADVNQWRSTKEVIRWFNNLENKEQLSYLTFDIVDFYPSITDNLLIKTLKLGKNTTT